MKNQLLIDGYLGAAETRTMFCPRRALAIALSVFLSIGLSVASCHSGHLRADHGKIEESEQGKKHSEQSDSMQPSQDQYTWILLHGLGESPDSFQDLATRLTSLGAFVFTPNLAELSLNILEGAEYSHLDLAKQIRKSIPVSALKRPVVVLGHSMGVQVGIELVEQLDSCIGFISLEGSLTWRDEKGLSKYQCTEGTTDGWQRLVERQKTTKPENRIPPEYAGRLAKTPPPVFCAQITETVAKRKDYTRRFFELNGPRIQVAGANSNGPLLMEAPGVKEAQGLDIYVVDDAKHWVHIDQPDQVWSVIMDWFSDIMTKKTDYDSSDGSECRSATMAS